MYGQDSQTSSVEGGFLSSRWHGETPLSQLFWRDMLIWSSLLNLVTSGAALGLLELDYPTWLSVLVHLSPLPWNLFLVASVWRAADRQGGRLAPIARIGSLIWLVVATIV